jgi:hypothetical protein
VKGIERERERERERKIERERENYRPPTKIRKRQRGGNSLSKNIFHDAMFFSYSMSLRAAFEFGLNSIQPFSFLCLPLDSHKTCEDRGS